jgi:hypothetical protein
MRRQERGSALIVALIVIIIAVGIGGAFLADTLARSSISQKGVQSDEAQMIAEAALEKTRRALWVYKSDGTYEWDQIIADHAAYSIDPDVHWSDYQVRKNETDFQTYMAASASPGYNTYNDAPLPGDPSHFFGTSMPFGEGAYMAIVRDNDDGDGDPTTDSDLQILVYITSCLPDGTIRQIEALVRYEDPTYTPDHAILVDGTIQFNGTPDVLGTKGKAHANGDIVLSGNPIFSISANATGTIDEGSAPTPPEGFNEGVPEVPFPEVNPTQYKSQAQYVLRSNGQVYDQIGNAVVGSGAGGGWNGWKFSGGLWSFSGGSTPPTATYYVEGSAKLSGAGGSPTRTMSIVAEGSIETTGNIKLNPTLTGTLFIAGGDVKLGGTAGAQFQGLVAAKEQIKTTGTFDHIGVLLAKNEADNYNLVTAGSAIDPDSIFGGTMTVTYNGGLETVLENPTNAVVIQNLRRLR